MSAKALGVVSSASVPSPLMPSVATLLV